jgi:hypothetical protein
MLRLTDPVREIEDRCLSGLPLCACADSMQITVRRRGANETDVSKSFSLEGKRDWTLEEIGIAGDSVIHIYYEVD